jgi:hypothetical protein
MPDHNAQHSKTAMFALTPDEWRDVQRAVRSVQDTGCVRDKQSGPILRGQFVRGQFVRGQFVRGLARISQFVRPRATRAVAPELQPLRDFLRESARHGPAVDVLAERLHSDGFSQAQIAALSFIVG